MPDNEARLAFPSILKSYMEHFRINQSDIAKELGVSKQTVSDWMTGKKFPRVDSMQALANLFGVMMSDMYTSPSGLSVLLERSGHSSFPLNDEEKLLIALYRGANDQARGDAIRTLEAHQKKDSLSKAE